MHKCPFGIKTKFGTTGSPEEFKYPMKQHLNLHETLTKCFKCFGSALKVEKRICSFEGDNQRYLHLVVQIPKVSTKVSMKNTP